MKERSLVQNLNNLKALPINWVVSHFDDVLTDCSSGNEKILNSDFLYVGEYPIVDQGQELIAGYTNQIKYLVKKKPPYIVFGDHTRIFKFINFQFAMGADGVKVLKPLDESKLLAKYLYYFFLTLNIPNTGYNRHYKYLKDIEIPIPSLLLQQKIAAILDAADAYRQKTKALMEKYDQLAQSLFLEMFGDLATNQKGWIRDKIANSCKRITVGVVIKPASYYVENGVIALRSLNIKPQRIELNDLVFFSHKSHSNVLSKSTLREGDVVIVRTGSTGTAAVVPKELDGCNCIDLIIVTPDKDKINPTFLSYFLNSGVGKRIVSGKEVGGIQKHFNIRTLNELVIPVPPIHVQTQFADRIQWIEAQKQQAQAALTKAEELFSSLLQSAFKGELVE